MMDNKGWWIVAGLLMGGGVLFYMRGDVGWCTGLVGLSIVIIGFLITIGGK